MIIDRFAPSAAAGLILAAALSTAGAANAAASTDITRFAGVWTLAQPPQPAIKTIDGRDPPLRPEARQLLQKRIADRRAGTFEDNVARCMRPGVPRILYQPRPMMILTTPRKVTFVHEFQHMLRHVPLNETLPPADELDFLWGGQSVGRWEGDTLVVETAGFNDKTQLDEAGTPHSPEMRVVERWRLVDADTLENRVTITDPKTFTAPWTTRVVFKRAPRGTYLQEHNCAETLLDPQLRASILNESRR